MRLRSSIAALLLSIIIPVTTLAASGETVVSSSCSGKGAKDIARCITDTQKQWRKEEYDFRVSLEKKSAEWHAVNDKLGVTTAFTVALQAFHEQLNRLRGVFEARMESKKKSFADLIAQKRASIPTQQRSARPGSSAARQAEGEKKCANKKDETTHRACMRPFLRLLDPYGRTGK